MPSTNGPAKLKAHDVPIWVESVKAKGLGVKREVNALALVNAGDELTLTFSATNLPPLAPGHTRDFFLFSSGWDKDSDFHVATGTSVTPLPWHGLDDQWYGRQARPAFTNDAWMERFNTRWCGARLVNRRQ